TRRPVLPDTELRIRRRTPSPALPRELHLHQTLRGREGERSEDQRPARAVDQDARADPHRQRGDHDHRGPRRLPVHPERVAQVGGQVLEPPDAPGVAPLLLEALDAAEGDPCSAHRLLCGDSLRPRELSRLHLQVEAELLLHVALQLALAEERTEPAPPTTGPADHARLPSRGLSHLLDRTESRGPGPPHRVTWPG